MKTLKTFNSAFVAPNCFKTVVGEYGITCYYSVCVGNKLNLSEINVAYCPSHLRHETIPTKDDVAFTCIYRIVDRSISYYKTPYKQCYPKKYTHHFGFIIFKCFTSFKKVKSFSHMSNHNYRDIKRFIDNLKYYYSK